MHDKIVDLANRWDEIKLGGEHRKEYEQLMNYATIMNIKVLKTLGYRLSNDRAILVCPDGTLKRIEGKGWIPATYYQLNYAMMLDAAWILYEDLRKVKPDQNWSRIFSQSKIYACLAICEEWLIARNSNSR